MQRSKIKVQSLVQSSKTLSALRFELGFDFCTLNFALEMMLSHSAAETQQFAFDLLNNLKKRQNVLALVGDLGSGKTTFTQGIARALGISQRVVSPTFVIMREYEIKFKIQSAKFKVTVKGSKLIGNLPFKRLYHLDLYRLQNINEIKELGVEEIWQDPNNLVIIEWAEKVRGILPRNTVLINFQYVDEKTREILVKVQNPKSKVQIKSKIQI